MSEIIPIESKDAATRVRTRLDGVFYRLLFMWSPRFERWTMSIENDSGEALLQGATITANAGITLSQTQAGMPPGEIVPVDTSGKGNDPGRNDLGSRVIVVYIPFAELPA